MMARNRETVTATLFAFVVSAVLFTVFAMAQQPINFPPPKDGVWVAKDFKFSTGETLPELRIAYKTIGEATNPPILILHGTGGSAANMLTPGFGGQMFGPGQPLDASKYFLIIPDALGTGGTSKPSNGLKAKFPKYNYDDMVDAQYRLVTEGLGLKRLRLVVGNSMGGMHAWVWGVRYPDMMDAIVPMASQPTEMSGRNWMTRRLIIDSIRKDPAYADGNYVAQPPSARVASVFYGIATNGGNLGLQKIAPNREAADKLLDQRLAAPFAADANDFVYQWDASRDYNPSPKLAAIKAAVLAINSADDERNPPELGVMDIELKRIANARLLLIPGSSDTFGHGTTAFARFWSKDLEKFLAAVPKKTGATQ